MLKFILHTIFQQNKMHDSTLDLFCDHDDDSIADEYAMDLEALASKYQVTVDYLIEEFLIN